MAKKKKDKELKTGAQTLITNRKARHEYEIVDKFEAGLVLEGSEVKSLREGGGSIQEAYIVPRHGELFVVGMTIPPYTKASMYEPDSTRDRKLLLHRREIDRLAGAVAAKGMTMVPLRLYLTERGLMKLEIGLARGKALVDKRRDLKERTIKREMDREMKAY